MADERVARLEVSPDFENVAVSRRFVAARLREADPAVSDGVIDDLQLAVSELVSNAIEHGRSQTVTVEVIVLDDAFGLAVVSEGPAPRVGPTREWVAAPADELAGRGLAIVRALADEVDVDHRGGGLRVAVWIRRRPGTPVA